MMHLTQAIRNSVAQENWYSALTLALTMPDICSKLARPNAKQGQRFIEWVNQNFSSKYTTLMPGPSGSEKKVWINGNDFYALRCAVLHEGSFDTSNHMKKEVDRAFREYLFTAPMPGSGTVHCNSFNGLLQLEIDQFTIDVADAVDAWQSGLDPESPTTERMQGLMTIALPGPDGSIDISPFTNRRPVEKRS